MGGSSSQVVGYKYYCGLMVVIGNRIEKLIAMNPDKRGWIPVNANSNSSFLINKPDLFGGDKQEGGLVGYVDVHLGADDQEQNNYLAEKDSEIVSAFPNLSYLVYRGLSDLRSFQFVSMSGMMKEIMYLVKRTRIKTDGSEQWYKVNESGDTVCEIAELINFPSFVLTDTYGTQKYSSGKSPEELVQVDSVDYLLYKTNTAQNSVGGRFVDFGDSVDDGTALDTNSACVSVGVTTENNGFIKIYGTGSYWATSGIEANPYGNVECIDFETVITNQETVPNDGRIRRDFAWTATFKSDKASNDFGIIFYVSGAQVSNDDQRKNISLSAYMNVSRQTAHTKNMYSPDINPIHKIREILTDYTAMNKPESDVNGANFKAAADRIYSDGLGISWAIQQKQCKEAIDELLYHIEAGIRVNRQTGKYEVVLFRDDLLQLDDAMVFNESNMKSFNPEISTSDDLINTLNVKFYDRENVKESAFSIYENGNIRTTDQEISEDVSFPYFTNIRNADLVSNWKLKQLSTPAWKGTFTTGKYDARKLNRYDVIKLSWSDLGIVELPVRVMKISLGDGLDNEVSIDFIEVLPYSSIDYQPISVDPPTNIVLPAQPNISTVFEMPYFEAVQLTGQTQLDAELANNPDIGYVMIASKKPQNNSLNAIVYVKDTDIYEQRGVVNYCPYAELDQNIDYLDTSFSVKNVDSILSVSSGSVFKIGTEFLVYVAYNVVTKILTVKRGALDTIPQKHNSGDKLFFYDEYPSFVRTQYLDSEVIKAKVLTTTPSSVLDISTAPELELEFNARMIRPYPPANIKLNSEYFIESMINTNDLTVTWVDRNRLQQTGGSVLAWVDGGITIENGTTYSIELSSESTVISTVSSITANTHTFDKSTLVPNKAHTLKLWSVRDGYDSYQIFEHEFFVEAIEITLTATATKTNVSGSTAPSAAMNVVVDETLTANMKWNGTSIKGKAEAGATITIEVQE